MFSRSGRVLQSFRANVTVFPFFHVKQSITRYLSVQASSFNFKPIKKILDQNLGDTVEVYGWVRSKRVFKDFSFVVVNDGSNINGIQVFYFLLHDL